MKKTSLFITLALMLSAFSAHAAHEYHLYSWETHKLTYVVTFAELGGGTKEMHYSFTKPTPSIVTITDSKNRRDKFSCLALSKSDSTFTQINHITCKKEGKPFVIETTWINDYNRSELHMKLYGKEYYVR